ncbi:hypothetical protein A8B83_13395 [Rhodobacteraceae bacterium EhC02]|nr:hypothetical protein A8B83_13395 [Rhodobacteraceae bacterium EhC02]
MAATLKFLRKLHSWLGIIALPWVILFGVTGFYLNHPDVIRSILPLTSYEDVGSRFEVLPKPLTMEEAERIAQAYWPESQMKSVSKSVYHGHEAINFEREAGQIIVAVDTGHYYVKSRLKNLQFSPDGDLVGRKIYWNYVFGVFHRTGWLGWSLGTILADITSLALITFGISGMVLWYLPKHKGLKRRLGKRIA